MFSSIPFSRRSICSFAVPIFALGPILAFASPVPDSGVPGRPFGCKGPDGAGRTFYLADGKTESECNVGLVCRWNLGDNPCADPQAHTVSQIPDLPAAIPVPPASTVPLNPNQPSSTREASAIGSGDPGANGYATNHAGGPTACNDNFEDHSEAEPYYVAVSPTFFAGDLNPNDDPVCFGHFIEATCKSRTPSKSRCQHKC
jgi:hypothetical protein